MSRRNNYSAHTAKVKIAEMTIIYKVQKIVKLLNGYIVVLLRI